MVQNWHSQADPTADCHIQPCSGSPQLLYIHNIKLKLCAKRVLAVREWWNTFLISTNHFLLLSTTFIFLRCFYYLARIVNRLKAPRWRTLPCLLSPLAQHLDNQEYIIYIYIIYIPGRSPRIDWAWKPYIWYKISDDADDAFITCYMLDLLLIMKDGGFLM